MRDQSRIWVRKIPWRRAWQPTPVLLPGESHGQRRLAGYSPWGHKESDTTRLLTHTKCGAKVLSNIPQHEKAVMCPAQRIRELEKLCSDRS